MTILGSTEERLQKMKSHRGFIAALDQSGGSTPGALSDYGIKEREWFTDEEMFAIVHQMRTRLIPSLSFTGERILGVSWFSGNWNFGRLLLASWEGPAAEPVAA